MMKQSLHIHTVLDDGRNTMEEMVRAGIEAGLESMGFSGHSWLPFGADWTMSPEAEKHYHREIKRLRKLYPEIRIYEGLELDLYSEITDYSYDYIIGSVHNLYAGGEYISLDESRQILEAAIDKHFEGNSKAVAEAYFEEVGRIKNADIVGHFDLISKFNEKGDIFREADYMDAALFAMRKLAAANMIFEINTGAISRGYRTVPYPPENLLYELRKLEGRITVTSDAHDTSGIACGYEEAVYLAKQCGFDRIWLLDEGGFVPYVI